MNLTGTLDMAEYLIGKGADVNAKSFVGKTPLKIAVQQGLYEYSYFNLESKCTNYSNYVGCLFQVNPNSLISFVRRVAT